MGAGSATLDAAYKVVQQYRVRVPVLEHQQVVGGNVGRSELEISLGGLAVPKATLAILLIPSGVAAVDGVANSLLQRMILLAAGPFANLVRLVLRRMDLHNRMVASQASDLEHPSYA